MYIHKLTIQNFRCFEKAEIELNYPGRRGTKSRPVPKANKNVNLFLGSNGSGKSSLFKAVTVGILSPVLSLSGFPADYLVRRTPGITDQNRVHVVKVSELLKGTSENTATIDLTIVIDDTDTELQEFSGVKDIQKTMIHRIGDIDMVALNSMYLSGQLPQSNLFKNDSSAFFLVGYGANRRTERPEGYSEQSRSPRYQRVAGLFEDYVGLVPFTHAHLELQSLGFLREASELLNRLLPNSITLSHEWDSQRRPLFEQDGILLPFNALSDGFRAFVGWIWDLLYQLARVQSSGDESEKPKLTDLPGVVIVDEIDLFLHPEWQRVVVQQVAAAFPKLQFLFSTHSPLVAGTLEPENLFVVARGPEGTATVAQYRENIHGLTANQVLTSSYFGLSSTRAPGTGTLDDLAQRETAPISLTETAEPLPDDQKEMLERMMQRAQEREKTLSGNGE